MKTATIKIIETALLADETVTKEDRDSILRAASRSTQTRPRPVGVGQAAQVLGCHPKTIYRYVRRGLLHTIHYSRRKVRFDLNEVEAFAARGIPDFSA